MQSISKKDIEILRDLARKIEEISHSSENNKRRQMWLDLNSLKAKSPVISVIPSPAWPEIIDASSLKCEGEKARGYENGFREMLYHFNVIKDDFVIEPHINMYWQIDTGNTYGFDLMFHHSGSSKGSYVWEPPIKDIEKDIVKLRPRELTIYKEKTLKEKEYAEEAFGDILGVNLVHPYWHTAGITHHVTELVGLEQLMYLPYDDPDGLHQLFSWLRDEHVAFNLKLEEAGIFELNHSVQDIGSGGFGYTNELNKSNLGNVKMADVWGYANSQESVGMSPEMYEEFIFPYECDIVKPFGLNYYGCCEPVHDRFKNIKNMPNLRGISVSPWADVTKCADLIKNDFVYSWKPNPALVCVNFDEKEIRRVTKEALKAAGRLNMNIILKDVETVQNEPERLQKWVEIVREEINNI